MGVIDGEALLAEIDADAPCGADLGYDPDFAEMERAAEGKPEQQFGETIIKGEPPNYRDVQRLALDLLGRTKDLRIAVNLTQALLRNDGLGGFAEGLELIGGLIDRYWDQVHPQLDPDDDNDPTLRINTLLALAAPSTVVRGVREVPLVRSRSVGTFSFRDYLMATGEIPAPENAETPAPESGTIEAAFRDCDGDALLATAAALGHARDMVERMESLLDRQVGSAASADFSPLTGELRRMEHLVSEWVNRRGLDRVPDPEPTDEPSADAATDDDSAAESAHGSAASGAPAVNGDIRSREDVVRTLDRLCAYFEKYEPSSPLPLLLERAKRLVSKSFLEILRDLAPDAVEQAEKLRGSDS